MSSAQQYEKILIPFTEEGLFTHLYAECGFLNHPTAMFQFEILPQKRDFFDLSSLTKALVTVPLVYQEGLENSLYLQDHTKVWLKDFMDPFDRNLDNVRVMSLLSHHSGLPAWRNLWTNHIDERGHSMITPQQRGHHIDKVLNAQILTGVGRYMYSDLGYLFLQRILEVRHGEAFAEIWQKFCKKQGLGNDITFTPNPDVAITTGHCAVRKRLLLGEVHDENAAALGGAAGHAGAFATGAGVSRYLRQLLETDAGRLIWSEHTRALAEPDPEQGLAGWWRGDGESSQVFGGGQSAGHLGFTGTAFWINMQTQAYGILLTNRVISGRLSSRITDLRKQTFTFFNEIVSS